MRILLYIVAVLGFLFLGFIWLLNGSPTPTIPPKKTPPPIDFNKTEYRKFDNLSSIDGFEVTNLNQFGEYFEGYYRPNEKMFWAMFFGEEIARIYVLIGQNGEIIDTFETARDPHAMNQYFVDIDGVTEMTPNGFLEQVSHVDIEGDVDKARLAQLFSQSQYYRKVSWTSLPRDSVGYSEKKSMHIMLHDGVWKRSLNDIENPTGYKGGTFDELITQYYHEPERGQTPPVFPPEKVSLELTFFDQQEFFPRRPASIGSPTGQGRHAQWRGAGYYTLKMGDAEIKFFIENDVQFTNFASSNTFHVQSHEDVDFVFLKHRPRRGEPQTFIVRRARTTMSTDD